VLFEDLEFSLPPNGIVGVIGPNGAGKQTLFRMIMGQEQASRGTFNIGGTVTLGYVDQAHSAIDPAKNSVRSYIRRPERCYVGNRLCEMPEPMFAALILQVPIRKRNVVSFPGGKKQAASCPYIEIRGKCSSSR